MTFINGTSTAKFLSCTFPPATPTLYTTVYKTVLPAACETSQWLATYTVTETCAGNKADYVIPVIPPGFVVTTVACPACKPTKIEITCPGAQPTGTGLPTVTIQGNGVTAAITASPIGAPSIGAAATYPTGGPIPSVTAVGSISGASGSPVFPGSNVGSGLGPESESGSDSGSSYSSCSGSNSDFCLSSGSSSGPGSSSDLNSCSGSGSGSGSCSSTTGRNNTSSNPPAIVTAGAPSLKAGVILFSGLALAIGHSFNLYV
ncbi:hypothetical protein AAE478_004841 [Parahypoxylon ruwenzoriense]